MMLSDIFPPTYISKSVNAESVLLDVEVPRGNFLFTSSTPRTAGHDFCQSHSVREKKRKNDMTDNPTLQPMGSCERTL